MVVERGETPGDQEGFMSYHSVAPPHLGPWHKVQPVGSWPSAFVQGPHSHQKVCDSALSLWLRTAMADGAAYIASVSFVPVPIAYVHTRTHKSPGTSWQLLNVNFVCLYMGKAA